METLVAKEPRWKETWKERLDVLKLKLELGKMDVREELEAFESELRNYINRLENLLDNYVKDHKQAKLIKGRLEEIQVQLVLAKADTKDLLYEETKKLRDKLYAIKWDTLDWMKTLKNEKTEELKEAIEEEMEFYTAQLEMMNVQLHLGKAEAREKWDELRAILLHRLQVLRYKVEHDAGGRWGEMRKEMAMRLRKWADRIE